MKTYPTVDYPTIIKGYVQGTKLRIENLDGDSYLLSPLAAGSISPAIKHDGNGFCLDNVRPFLLDGKTWAITHLQKYSHRGFLKVAPDCYHRWWFWKLQEKDAQGSWLPGTERGLYFRKPFSWRWDIAGTVIDGVLRHWIWTKGYIGGHWD